MIEVKQNGMILGIPTDDQFEYEFMVVIPRNDGNFDWHSNHETELAYDVAEVVGGAVVHNLRIAHKEKKS